MSTTTVRLFLFVALLLPLASGQAVFGWAGLRSAAAQQTYAVVVGISDYALGQPGKGDLNFADDDARQFYSMLRSPAGGNVPETNIILLTEKEATRANILKAITLFKKAAKADRIIFFFSGHGDKGFLLPYDAGPGVVVRHDDVRLAFRESPALTKLLLTDACKSGSMDRYRHKKPKSTVKTPPTLNNNVIIMVSSRDYEFSQELSQLKHGAFTYFLVEGAKGKADTDHNHIVTIRELYAYMHQTIRQVTNNQQTPVLFGRFKSDTPFSVAVQ